VQGGLQDVGNLQTNDDVRDNGDQHRHDHQSGWPEFLPRHGTDGTASCERLGELGESRTPENLGVVGISRLDLSRPMICRSLIF
jgi:hypothetical protein